MYMEGPAEAAPGDTVVYTLRYEVKDVPGTGVVVVIPNYIEYLSSRLVAGNGQVTSEPESGDIALRWGLDRGTGILEVVLRVPEGTAIDQFTVGAEESGTQTTQTLPVVTTIVR